MKRKTLSLRPLPLIAAALLGACQDLGDSTGNDPSILEPDQEGILYDVAGIVGSPGSDADGGSPLNAHLSWPQDITVNPIGEVYIVDSHNHCVRVITDGGTILRYMGSGKPGDGTGGPANEVALDTPSGLTIGPTGDLWLASWKNGKVKRVDIASYIVSAPIGTTPGYGGDGGPASEAQLNLPSSVVFDEDGNMYISDQSNQRIRKVDTQMNISTFAGSGQKGYLDGAGETAEFSFPIGSNAIPGGRIAWAHHPDGLLVADTENHRIRLINLETREVFTIAGTGQPGYSGDGGSARNAQLNYPTDIYMIEDHEIYFADSRNHVIRKIDTFGSIWTVAGTGVPGSSPNGTPATSAKLNTPCGIFFDETNRTLYIADTYNHQVKKVKLAR